METEIKAAEEAQVQEIDFEKVAQEIEEMQDEKARKKEQKRAKKERKKRRPMKYPQLFLFHALILIIMVWTMTSFVIGFILAPNHDMTPSVNFGDLVVYYRLHGGYKAQDVVVLKKNGEKYIGRIVAASGDTVNITDDESLIINGNAVQERKIFYKTPRYEGGGSYPVKLEEGSYFVLVDSRQTGKDSRIYGTVSKKEILGKVISISRWNNI